MATTTTSDVYEDLTDRYARISNLTQASMLLNWDQQVTMPEGGTPARAKQLSALSTTAHELLTDPEVGELLEELSAASLDESEAAVVREIRRRYEREVSVPGPLVEELTEVQANAQQAWQTAKAEDEFDTFAPHLERIRDLQLERAEHIDPDADPYEVMFAEGEPYLPLETVEEIFDRLREVLVPLIDRIRAEGADLASPFEGTYDESHQRALSEAVLDELGYDREHGRLDTAPHPFMSGNQFDARVTTRFKPEDPLDALTATIHEFGHATYQLGLPREHYGSPLGQYRSSGVHESQSRFWENHVGRTEPFWEYILPTFTEHVPGHDDLSVREAYEAANRIYPENLIRVEADELTYHLHIILRADVERQFVAGEIDVEEIPAVWNETMEELLGVRPETDSEGCLQDIHWTGGFASFQNYTVGSVLAAQLDAAMRASLEADVDELIRAGEFEPIREWHVENVHRHGQRYPTDELVEVATGEPLSAEPFVEYATDKFETLYGL